MSTMILNAAIKATPLLVLAWLATALLRRSSADLRHRIWLAAFAALTLLLLPASVPAPLRITTVAGLDSGSVVVAAGRSIPFLPLLWLTGFTVVMVRLTAGLILLSLRTRRSQATEVAGVRVADRLESPLTWGIRRPMILLPAYVADWPEQERDIVLQHERAHIARHDWLWQSLTQVICAIFWFHPLVWFAQARLRQEAELAADDLVLAGGTRATEYATRLLEVAKHVSGRMPHAGVAPSASLAAVRMVQRPVLTRRITSILDTTRVRARAGLRSRSAIVLATLCFVPLLAAFQSADIVTLPKVISRVNPQYPESAKQAKYQGAVTLGVVVHADGTLGTITVKKPLGLGLDEAAVDAVRQWQFAPGAKNGEPVAVEVEIVINFTLL